MALMQFEPEYKKLLGRYRQAVKRETSKSLTAVDLLAKRLATKGLPEKERGELLNKLKDKFKKVKTRFKEDLTERAKAHAEAVKKPPEKFDAPAALKVLNNVKREMAALEKKVQRFAETGGVAPPPPKLPEFHFGADYNRMVSKFGGKLSPTVVSALDKLDENHDAVKAITLIKAARVELDKQGAQLNADLGGTSDPKEKVRLSALTKELADFRKELKELELRIFLVHRLKT